MVKIGRLNISLAESEPRPVVMGEIGHISGGVFRQFLDHEYLSELRYPASLRVYDRMRRSDAQIQAVLLALELPIRSTRWYMKPASESARDKQIADDVEKNLFEGLSTTWDDTLRSALTMFAFGHSLFEVVYAIDSAGFLRWRKFADRPQRSITQFLPDERGDLQTVEQHGPNGIVPLPASKLLVFTHRMEDGDPRGTSVLRAAYKSWFIKDYVYKIVNIGIEQEYVGIPWAQVPANMEPELQRNLEDILRLLTQGEKAFFWLPSEVELKRYQSQRDQQSIVPYIEHHDLMISRSVLAQFLNLGAASVGSYALSEDHSDLFLMSLDGIADYVAQIFNRQAIPTLVGANWNVGEDEMPQLAHDPVGARDIQRFVQAVRQLTGAGSTAVITPDGPLEDYMREFLGLPERSEEAASREPETPPADPEGEDEDEDEPETLTFAEPRQWRRPLTPWEERIKLTALERRIERAEQQLARGALAELERWIEERWPEIEAAVRTGDVARLVSLSADAPGLAAFFEQFSLDLILDSARNAADELGAAVPAMSDQVRQRVAAQAPLLAAGITAQVVSRVQAQALNAIQSETPAETALSGLRPALTETGERALERLALVRVSVDVNAGRDIAREFAGVKLAIWSAILDNRVCPLCRFMDGRVIETSHPDYKRFTPPVHSGDRCIWVLIDPEEVDPPEVDWQTPPQALIDEHGYLTL